MFKNKACLFAEWIEQEGYIRQDNGRWFTEVQKDLSVDYSTKQLYEKFNKKKYKAQ